MTESVAAIFDGKVFHPVEPITIPANTRVKISIEIIPDNETPRSSFLQVARSLNLDGPPDWASNLDEHLYGETP